MDPYLYARAAIFLFLVYGAVQYTRSFARPTLPISPEPQHDPMTDAAELLSAIQEETKIETVRQGVFTAPRPPKEIHLPGDLTSRKVQVGDEWLPWDRLTQAQKASAALHYLQSQ